MPKRTRPAPAHPIFEAWSLGELVKLSNGGYSYYTLRDIRSGAAQATKRFQQYWSQEADGRALDRLGPRAIRGLVRVQLVRAQELVRLVLVAEVEAMPVDDRAAPEDQTDRLELGQAQVVERAEVVVGRRGRHRGRPERVRRSSCRRCWSRPRRSSARSYDRARGYRRRCRR